MGRSCHAGERRVCCLWKQGVELGLWVWLGWFRRAFSTFYVPRDSICSGALAEEVGSCHESRVVSGFL